jgi:hypothetical protein
LLQLLNQALAEFCDRGGLALPAGSADLEKQIYFSLIAKVDD